MNIRTTLQALAIMSAMLAPVGASAHEGHEHTPSPLPAGSAGSPAVSPAVSPLPTIQPAPSSAPVAEGEYQTFGTASDTETAGVKQESDQTLKTAFAVLGALAIGGAVYYFLRKRR